YDVKVPIVTAAAAEFNVTLIDPEEERDQAARTAFRTWVEARKNQKVDKTVAELAIEHGVLESFVQDTAREFSLETAGARKSPDRLRLEAWAAERRGQTVPETSTQLQIDYRLSF